MLRSGLSLLVAACIAGLPTTGAAQSATRTISGAELKSDGSINITYRTSEGERSIDVPGSLLLEIASQLGKSDVSQAPETAPAKPASGAASRSRKRVAKAVSATGQVYAFEIYADSVITIRYEDDSGTKVASLPVDIVTLAHGHHEVLSGRMNAETHMYVEPRTGTFWFSLSRGFNYKALILAFALVLGGLVFGVVQILTRRIKRERDELRASGRRMMRIREAERSHLASELHDGPVQDVQRILRSNLNSIARAIPMSESDDLTALEGTLREVAGSLRNICSDLRPPVLAHFGLEKAVESVVRSFELRNPDVGVRQELSLGPDELPEEIRLVAYRILQEALTNIEKHAGARNVRIELTRHGDEARLVVEDDGRGFRVTPRFSKLEERGHFGLSGMRQRVDSVGGMLHVDSSVGRGTRITVLLPSLVDEGIPLAAFDRLR